MNRRDWKLLDKQMHELPRSQRRDGTMILAIAAVFFVGVTLGGYLFGTIAAPTQIAFDDSSPASPGQTAIAAQLHTLETAP